MNFWGVFLIFVNALVYVQAGRGGNDMYKDDVNVLELTPSTFDKAVYGTNYTTMVKFYAPWCGYCRSLEPIYHKLGKYFNQDAKYSINIASVNCDKDTNQELCSRFRISGFPTILVFRPLKFDAVKNPKVSHAVETYNGERSLKSMVRFLTSRMKNYAKRIYGLEGDALLSWLAREDGSHKVLLITKSYDVTPLYKSLALDFLGVLEFGLVSTKLLDKEHEFEHNVNGKDIKLPLKKDEELPRLLLFNENLDKIVKYEGKYNDKIAITQWITENTDIKPTEGLLSRKEAKFFRNVRLGKKLPSKKPSSKKTSSQKSKKKSQHDEL